uniref:Uncharacterized protein TCIL3000_5_5020 n=1 Tax=Trypanosoma congolense (strain IL3000) TaxID=1068625 RepID=G0UM76_TRYCI|nr:unnamed protein product [Trypanosoma congolense IL3000]
MSLPVYPRYELTSMLRRQRETLCELPVPVQHVSQYLGGQAATMTNVYHSRGNSSGVTTNLLQDQLQEGEAQLLTELLNEDSRINLDVEKVLQLACNVLDKAGNMESGLGERALDLLARITNIGELMSDQRPPSVE